MDIQAMPSEAVHEEGLDLPKEISWTADPREERGHLARDVLDANSLETGTEEEVSQIILDDDVRQALDLALLGADRISALERNHLPLAEAGRRQPCRMEGEGELRQQGELVANTKKGLCWRLCATPENQYIFGKMTRVM
jgi:hypothetical protein